MATIKVLCKPDIKDFQLVASLAQGKLYKNNGRWYFDAPGMVLQIISERKAQEILGSRRNSRER